MTYKDPVPRYSHGSVTGQELAQRQFIDSEQRLNGARYQRDTLKRLLAIAKAEDLPGWTSSFATHLEQSRKRINRLSAGYSRLKKRTAASQSVIAQH